MDTPITRAEHDEFAKRMQDEHKRLHYRINEIEKNGGKNPRLGSIGRTPCRIYGEHGKRTERPGRTLGNS